MPAANAFGGAALSSEDGGLAPGAAAFAGVEELLCVILTVSALSFVVTMLICVELVLRAPPPDASLVSLLGLASGSVTRAKSTSAAVGSVTLLPSGPIVDVAKLARLYPICIS